LLKNVNVPEKITEQKIIVYKSRVDVRSVRATAENMKTQLFRKLVFIKPKPEEVQIISMDKYFDPYVVVDGEYSIEYSKNWTRNIQVDDTMQEITIFSEKIRPVSLRDHLSTPCKIVKLTGEGRHKFEAKAHLIFDKHWRKVGLEQLPFVPFEEQPEKILNMIDQKYGNFNLTTGKGVELLKSKIVHRPSDILIIHNELFKVCERAIIYKPMYKVTIRNLKTNKEMVIIIDAISGKTSKNMQQTPVLLEKKSTTHQLKKSSKKTSVNETTNPKRNTE
jgi:hypothetical protein